ncbi:hypothetical protein, partial [Streptomyces turgidiscabies]|uniref:hypothetical protein n=1 Tax=Streptomyces turgidiscabies TaxID=85558 RepID=UPI0038F7C774
KTFLLLYALENANPETKQKLLQLIAENPENKVAQVLAIFKECNVDEWAIALKEKYFKTALQHLEEIAVVSSRKKYL